MRRASPLRDLAAAAVYAAGEQGKTFTLPELADRLGLKGANARSHLGNLLYKWYKTGRLGRVPTVGPVLYRVTPEHLDEFKPAPPPPPPPPPAPVAAPADNRGIVGALQDLRQPPPASFDALLRSWLAGQLAPYGQMLQAAVAEIEHLRRDMATVMEVLTKPEGDRPALPEPTPRPALQLPETNGGHQERRAAPREQLPVEDSALALIIARLGPEWHVNPAACKDFEELDSLTQNRVVRALRTANSNPERWAHLGKQHNVESGVPAALWKPGTWWAFRAGKKDRVLVRRNGATITLEALVKRNDRRWYGSER